MKVIGLFAAIVTCSVGTMTHAQTPNSTAAVKAKAAATGSHPTVIQSLDTLVKHLQNKGFVVSHVQKDFNPDGTLSHYSVRFSDEPERKDLPATSRHPAVEMSVDPGGKITKAKNPPSLPLLDRSHTGRPVSAKQLTQSLMVLNAEAFDGGRLDYIKQMGKSRRFTSAQVSEMLATFSFDDDRGDAAVALYPQVVDRENFATVLAVFSFDDGREAVIKRLDL